MDRTVKNVVMVAIIGACVAQNSAAEIVYVDKAPFYLYERKEKAIPGIVISGATVTSNDIAAAIKDETKFRKEGNTVILLTNLLIKWDGGGLKIENEKRIFGKGTITIFGQDEGGKACQVTKEFEIRKMPF